jgi:CubicO group peptidase (beta-lactamase class C family)
MLQNQLLLLIQPKPNLLKTALTILLISSLIAGCKNSGQNKNSDDSFQYHPPAPGAIDKDKLQQYYRKLNSLFDTALLNKGFNGGILIARDGAIIYEKYAGFADLRKKNQSSDNSNKITDTTSLHIASTSKTFTAVAILRMTEQGKLSINDPLKKFFPLWPYPGITVKMLLNHRSGLPNYLYFLSDSDCANRKFGINKDVLNFLISKKPAVNFSPNTHFSYSNTNFVLLALIIEKISGKSFPEYMQHEIFGPLQMNHTFIFTLKDTLKATPSFSYSGTYLDIDYLDGIYGDKNVYSTPRDLLKWDQALYTDQLISKQLLDSSFSGYSFERPSVHNYGLGWRLQFLPNGKKIVYHYGKWHGTNAAFARLMDEKATIIVLGNKFTNSIYNAAHLCYDIFGDYLQGNEHEEEETDSISTGRKKTMPDLKAKKSLPEKKTHSKQKH